MKERIYYRVVFELKSALSIGGSDSDLTDNDIVLDSRGLPLIPATSVSGVMRSALSEGSARDMFGFVEGGKQRDSAVRVYDFTHVGGNEAVSVRDNVSLENKVAKDGAKFDRQIVERGARFRGFVEITDIERCNPRDIEVLLGKIESGELLMGSKTTRGLGRVCVRECKCVRFMLPVEKDAWLMFDMFDDESWRNVQDVAIDSIAIDDLVIHLDLQQRGAISIREYFTTPNEADFGQLSMRVVEEGKETVEQGKSVSTPIIPGSSWAGAFRDRYTQFSSEKQRDELFGYVREKNNETAKSRIVFSESIVTDGTWKTVTRNSIDRFTGGTLDRALFTEKAYFGGKTQLEIRAMQAAWCDDVRLLAPVFAVIADLHNGFLGVGGLTAVGHGLFCVTSANMSVGGISADKFEDLLLRKDASGFAVPDIAAILDSISKLSNGGNER